MARQKQTITIEQALDVLGINRTTSIETAKSVFQNLRSANHPDKVDSDDLEGIKQATAEMVLINQAWDKLKTVLLPQAELDAKDAKAKEAKEAKAKAKEETRDDMKVEFSENGISVKLKGEFTAVTLIECLYHISGNYLDNLGDVISNPSGMVDRFRAFSTGRKHRVYSMAMLDSKSRVIRVEELVSDNPDVKGIATQALFHGASSVYLVSNSVDGSVPKSLHPAIKKKMQALSEGLALLEIELHDYIVVGHAGYYSEKESKFIPKQEQQKKAA